MKAIITLLATAICLASLSACATSRTAKTKPMRQPAVTASRGTQHQANNLPAISEGPRSGYPVTWGDGFGPY
jgi:hypothetical protein